MRHSRHYSGSSGNVFVKDGFHDPSVLAGRTLVTLVTDFSYSMAPHSEALNYGVSNFWQALADEATTNGSIEISHINFSTDVHAQDYAPASYLLEYGPPPADDGVTHLGKALDVCFELSSARHEAIRANGIDCRPPIVVVLTDGEATDQVNIASAINAGYQFMPLSVDERHTPTLSKLFGVRPIALQTMDFVTFFRRLVGSVSVYSRSIPGQEPKICQLMLEAEKREAKIATFRSQKQLPAK